MNNKIKRTTLEQLYVNQSRFYIFILINLACEYFTKENLFIRYVLVRVNVIRTYTTLRIKNKTQANTS